MKLVHVLTWSELSGCDRVLDLVGEPLDLLDVLWVLPLRLRAGVELGVHRHPSVAVVVELVLLDHESLLDTLLPGPVLSVRLSLNEDLRSTVDSRESALGDGRNRRGGVG